MILREPMAVLDELVQHAVNQDVDAQAMQPGRQWLVDASLAAGFNPSVVFAIARILRLSSAEREELSRWLGPYAAWKARQQSSGGDQSL